MFAKRLFSRQKKRTLWNIKVVKWVYRITDQAYFDMFGGMKINCASLEFPLFQSWTAWANWPQVHWLQSDGTQSCPMRLVGAMSLRRRTCSSRSSPLCSSGRWWKVAQHLRNEMGVKRCQNNSPTQRDIYCPPLQDPRPPHCRNDGPSIRKPFLHAKAHWSPKADFLVEHFGG